MRNKLNSLSAALMSLMVFSCSIPVSTANNRFSLNKEGDFNIQAITFSYLKRKLDTFIAAGKGQQLIKEVNYAKFKHTPTLAYVLNNNIETTINFLNNPDIKHQMETDPPFAAYIYSLFNAPGTPLASVTGLTTSSFMASWEPVANITGYGLVIDSGTEIKLAANITSYLKSGLNTGSVHTFYIVAYRGPSVSQVSNLVSFSIKPESPVINLPAQITYNSFKAGWSEAAGATDYKVFVNGTEYDAGTSTSLVISGLSPETEYSYYVVAYSGNTASAPSETLPLTTLATAPPNLSEGLLGFYPFNNNKGTDESGYNRNATVKEAAVSLAKDRRDNDNQAVMINDAALDNIIIPNTTTLIEGGPFSVSGWANFPVVNDGAHHMIAGKHRAGDSNGFFIFVQNGKLGFFVSGEQVTTDASVNDGGWHHVTGTYDGNTAILYIDGVFCKQFNVSYTTNNQPFNISWSSAGGKIDSVRFYNRVLEASEISQLMNYD
jgi:hypothetical protein